MERNCAARLALWTYKQGSIILYYRYILITSNEARHLSLFISAGSLTCILFIDRSIPSLSPTALLTWTLTLEEAHASHCLYDLGAQLPMA